MSTENAIDLVARALSRARGVVVLTGAGISAESGLRTFRGATAASAANLPADMRALWADFDPMTLATPQAFDADPEHVTRWYDWRRLGCLAAEPNPGHLALAEMERSVTARGGRFTLLTQNVDRLHHRAGSTNVVELHGSIIDWRCVRCGTRTTPPPHAMDAFPPRAPCCSSTSGALLRPDVVWFGEMLPGQALDAADEAIGGCDLFLSVGTSSQVHPAAGFVQIAAARGATTVEINAEPTPISRMVSLALHGRAGELLPQVVASAMKSMSDPSR